MKKIQEDIKKFNDEMEWSNPNCIKDLMLNMTEEIGEMWNLIKWVDTKKQQELIKDNRHEVEDFVGNMIYLVLKIAYMCDVDSEKAVRDIMKEYEKRFPKERIKGTHSNTFAGGTDLK